jgi:hypothetical protein
MIRISTLLQWIFMVAASSSLLYGCFFSDWAKHDMEQRQAQERADSTPHVIREADGCKVYAFRSGRLALLHAMQRRDRYDRA